MQLAIKKLKNHAHSEDIEIKDESWNFLEKLLLTMCQMIYKTGKSRKELELDDEFLDSLSKALDEVVHDFHHPPRCRRKRLC